MEKTTALDIAKKMAAYFNQHISNEDLITWNIKSLSLLAKHYPDDDERATNATDFLASFSYCFIPALLKPTTKSEKIQMLINEIPDLFIAQLYVNIKPALAEIGKAWLTEFEEHPQDEDEILELMTILTHLMVLAEMYREHEYIDLKQDKAA